MTMWAYTPSFTYIVGTPPRHLLHTDCPASLPPLLVQWAHTSSFYDTVGMYPLIYLHRMHHQSYLLYTNCPASFPLYLKSEPIPPHFMTQWAYAPHLLTKWALSSLISSLICTVGPYFLIYDMLGLYPLIFLHIGHHPRRLLFTNCPVSVPPLPTQWAHTFSFYNLLTPLNLETGIKGQIQFLQIINSLWFTMIVFTFPIIRKVWDLFSMMTSPDLEIRVKG